MANIAILGWGSLIWDPRDLQFDGQWRENGPLFPLEFSRLSASSLTSSAPGSSRRTRLTLTITPNRPLVPTLWTFSRHENLDDAIADLARREGCGPGQIGYWECGTQAFHAQREQDLLRSSLERWWHQAEDRGGKWVDAVIWTDLGPNFQMESGCDFHLSNVFKHLDSLSGEHWDIASEYILRTPSQVATAMRPALETYIHERNFTAGFTRPLLGPRAGLERVHIEGIPVFDEGLNQPFNRDAMLPVWVNGKPGRVWFYQRAHGSTRFEFELDVPMEGLEEIVTPEGQTKWFFGTKHFMDHHPFVMDAAGLTLTFHRR